MANRKTIKRTVDKPKLDRHHSLIALLLIAVTAIAYWPVLNASFINSDDPNYVVLNRHIQSGLTPQSVRWAFTTYYESNWHPLTWVSHMLDWQLFGQKPMGHHLVNLLFHMMSVVLLFYALRWMTGFTWRSAVVALLFAIHPLHVESVAWVAERKDVLSTFFWMLTLLAYVRYVRKPSFGRYILVLTAFILGLMSKPMLVSLPLALLMLDFWPLGRMGRLRSTWGLVVEKAPLLALSAVSCFLTYRAQCDWGAVATLQRYSIGVRLANAVVAYVGYIVKMVWPYNLALFYPHPGPSLPIWQVVGAAVFLALASVLAFRAAERRPYVLMGWLWYMVTLIPVIGLLQVGSQSMADRYTYAPLIGLFVIAAWGVPDILEAIQMRTGKRLLPSRALYVVGGGLVVVLAVLTHVQAGYWHDNITLFEHSVRVVEDDYLAYNSLGCAYADAGRREDAITQFQETLRIDPDFFYAKSNLAIALARSGRQAEAIPYLRDVLKVDPNDVEFNNSLGIGYAQRGEMDDAVRYFRIAVKLAPDNPQIQDNLARAVAESRYMHAHYAN